MKRFYVMALAACGMMVAGCDGFDALSTGSAPTANLDTCTISGNYDTDTGDVYTVSNPEAGGDWSVTNNAWVSFSSENAFAATAYIDYSHTSSGNWTINYNSASYSCSRNLIYGAD